MIIKKRFISILLIILVTPLLYGCTKVDALKIKLGMKNNDFEYIKQGKIKKIVIQNVRDPGFRFVVTDKKAIADLYDILSTAKEVTNKSTLDPDYEFQMEESSSKIYKFNYIAGLDKKDAGNLYSSDKIYVVSKRIDNDIIKNFWNIRKPKDFNKIYYGLLLDQADAYAKGNGKGKTIGINLNNDVEAAKFIFSTDLEDFKANLASRVSSAELMPPSTANVQTKSYDTVMEIKTIGYKTFIYKGEITFTNKQNNSQKKYYITIQDTDKTGNWTTTVVEKKPPEW
ncbi:hypothetical protein [Candidatus Clostridium stratigraminis]|uniref:YhfM-like domain-containing protein n=1 Tax=Candidatus Clostridium stratigraminis TaxID=3381661 RepID=A0ABW8T4Y3_9CLOT